MRKLPPLEVPPLAIVDDRTPEQRRDDGDVRYLPSLVAEIFGGRYFTTFYPDGTCAVTIRMTRNKWHQLRRR